MTPTSSERKLIYFTLWLRFSTCIYGTLSWIIFFPSRTPKATIFYVLDVKLIGKRTVKNYIPSSLQIQTECELKRSVEICRFHHSLLFIPKERSADNERDKMYIRLDFHTRVSIKRFQIYQSFSFDIRLNRFPERYMEPPFVSITPMNRHP